MRATVAAAVGVTICLQLGIALGRSTWSVFATNVGVVAIPIVPRPVLTLLVAMGLS